MQITLAPQLEQLIKERMKSGQYSSPEAVLEDALALLSQRPLDWTATDLKREINLGLKDLNEGKGLDLNQQEFRCFINELKNRISNSATTDNTSS